jgi:lipopolysaccharide/colanic/teichoic acid biosynthesis glycosyltransferase
MSATARDMVQVAIADPGTLVRLERRPAYHAAKRALDVVAAAILLVLLVPLWLVISLAIVVDSGWPIIYRGDRIGRGMRTFSVFKFRSMRADADPSVHAQYLRELLQGRAEDRGGVFKVPDDPRITRVGRFLRKSSLDELPQLVNVLRGEMSLVGPRPEVPYAVEDYEPWMYRRFEVVPGITGLWQVRGRGRIGVRGMLQLDVEYAESCDLALDLAILLRTVPAVLRGTGAA